MVEELILAGADIIKVGIGPGDHSLITRHHLGWKSSPCKCLLVFANGCGVEVWKNAHHLPPQALCAPPARRRVLGTLSSVLWSSVQMQPMAWEATLSLWVNLFHRSVQNVDRKLSHRSSPSPPRSLLVTVYFALTRILSPSFTCASVFDKDPAALVKLWFILSLVWSVSHRTEDAPAQEMFQKHLVGLRILNFNHPGKLND